MNLERLRGIREDSYLKQKDLLCALGVSKSTYSRWETGDKLIPLKHLVNLCNYLEISLDYALGLSNIKEKKKQKIFIHNQHIGQKLVYVRKKNHLTQKALAEAIHTTQSTISSYENGKTTILTAFLCDICIKYHVSADWMLH